MRSICCQNVLTNNSAHFGPQKHLIHHVDIKASRNSLGFILKPIPTTRSDQHNSLVASKASTRDIHCQAASSYDLGGLPGDNKPAVGDTWLGNLFLKFVPAQFAYLLSYLMPISVALAAAGACYGPSLIFYASQMPVLRSIAPLVWVLQTLAVQQPWATLTQITFSLISPLYAFMLMPLLDFLLGQDLTTQEEVKKATANEAVYRYILYAFVPISYLVAGVATHLVSTMPITNLAFLGVSLSCGVANGILFTVAHELLHGSHKIDRILSNVLLAQVCYMHWSKSHLLHHVKVATPEDPSSARKNESLWTFIPRSIWGNIVDAYSAEATRRKAKKVPFLSVENRALWWAGVPMGIAATAWVFYGWKGLTFYLVQAYVGVVMLEAVNYVQHYGLQREKLPSGRYERITTHHSWNASTLYTNCVSFKLQRHSDHHAHDNRPYYLLETVKDAPQLPPGFGYPAMMLLATVPPLFYKVMNPILEEVQGA